KLLSFEKPLLPSLTKCSRSWISFASDLPNPQLEGIGIDNFFIGERQQIQLLEHFVNEGSSGFSNDNNLLNQDLFPQKAELFILQYHTPFPSPDEINLRNQADPNARALFYGLNQPQQSILHGNQYLGSLNLLDNALIARTSLNDPTFSISLRISPQTDGRWKIHGSFSALDSLSSEEIVLMVGIASKERSTNSGQTVYHELIKFLPSAAGTYYQQAWQMGESETFQFFWRPDGFDTDSLIAFAFLQNINTKEVYQVQARDQVGLLTNVEDLQGRGYYISPNPNQGRFWLKSAGEKGLSGQLSIFDVSGRIVLEQTVDTNPRQIEIDISSLPKGMYLFQFKPENGGIYSQKIIRE
ncbi:MAG: T9SS type A sorting domain-containing protein, partial [Bacteroidota bacterium]